jgi:hypothetical protein
VITYLYWIVVGLLTLLALVGIGGHLGRWKPAWIVAGVILLGGAGSYYFHFRQIFVKRWGGVMVIRVPAGQRHISATWKDENLWVENYDPASNTCHFDEYARGNLLEGKVTIRDCNPLVGGPLPAVAGQGR